MASRSTLPVHFVHYPLRDIVMILEEGIHPILHCPKCEMFLTCWALNVKHQATVMSARGEERERKQRQEEEAQRSM